MSKRQRDEENPTALDYAEFAEDSISAFSPANIYENFIDTVKLAGIGVVTVGTYYLLKSATGWAKWAGEWGMAFLRSALAYARASAAYLRTLMESGYEAAVALKNNVVQAAGDMVTYLRGLAEQAPDLADAASEGIEAVSNDVVVYAGEDAASQVMNYTQIRGSMGLDGIYDGPVMTQEELKAARARKAELDAKRVAEQEAAEEKELEDMAAERTAEGDEAAAMAEADEAAAAEEAMGDAIISAEDAATGVGVIEEIGLGDVAAAAGEFIMDSFFGGFAFM